MKLGARLRKNDEPAERRGFVDFKSNDAGHDHDLLDSASDIPPHVAECAVEWLVELQSGGVPDDATLKALQQWLEEHPDHQRAWQRIEAINGKLRSIEGVSSIAHATLAKPYSAKRRETLKRLAVLLFAGNAAWVAQDNIPWHGCWRTSVPAWASDAPSG